MRDYDQSRIRIPGLGNKSHSGIARRNAFLISCSYWPSHSVIIIAEMHWRRPRRTRGNTHRKVPRGGGGVINDRREFKQTLISVQVRGIKAAVHDHLIKPLWKGREGTLFGWIHFAPQICFVTVSYIFQIRIRFKSLCAPTGFRKGGVLKKIPSHKRVTE